MSGEIAVNGLVMAKDRARVQLGLDEYCACELLSLATVAPAAGSREHDEVLLPLLRSSLESYRNVILSIVDAMVVAQESLTAVDACSANAIASR